VFFGIQRQALLWGMDSVDPDVVDAALPAADRLHTMVWRRAMHTLIQPEFMALARLDTDSLVADEEGRRAAITDEVAQMRADIEAGFEKVILDGIAGGEFRDQDARVAVRAALAAVDAMSAAAGPARRADRLHDFQQIATDLARFAVGGLAATRPA
jgi:hypothetical protein